MARFEIRHTLEAVITFLLFTLQNIVYGGYAIGIMTIPLFVYLIGLWTSTPNLEREITVLLLLKEFMVGRLIALVGFTIFLIAIIQLLTGYIRHTGLVTTGFYSVVRHPQYTGVTIIALGLTFMVLTLQGYILMPILMWFVQVLGYVALASYEEYRLRRKYGEKYREYRLKVPFMFPLKCPSRIPEIIFTVLLSLGITLILIVFPYQIIRL